MDRLFIGLIIGLITGFILGHLVTWGILLRMRLQEAERIFAQHEADLQEEEKEE